MKNTIIGIALVTLCCAIALMGCRKEDASPVYNYIGGSQIPSTADEGEGDDVDLTADVEEEQQALPYSAFNLSECDASTFTFEGSGFVFDQADFNTLWNEWCDQPTSFGALDETFVAYYAVKVSGCSEIRLTNVQRQNDTVVIDIEKAVPDASCVCTKPDKIWRMMLAVQKVEGTTPTFNETTVEAPCE